MKVIIVGFCLLIFFSTAYSQPIQKYVIDGKTYYGEPPTGLSQDVEVENVRMHNTYVDPADRRRSDSYNKKSNAEWNRDVNKINRRNSSVKRNVSSEADSIIRDIENEEKRKEIEGKHDWERREEWRKQNRAK